MHAKYIETIDIPSSVLELHDYCFYDCVNLTSITLHDGLQVIGYLAFEGSSITSLSIPKTVRYVYSNAWGFFGNMEQLESVDVSPDNPRYYSIDGVMFTSNYNANHLDTLLCYPKNKSNTEYTIPQGTKRFYEVFSHVNKLRKIVYPSTLDTVSYHSGCSNLERIDIHRTIQQEQIADFCPKLSAVYFYQDAPTLKDYTKMFTSVSPSFCIYYDANKSGWSTPTWHGYPARPFNAPTPPTEKKAVIVIPGICGSELTDRNNNDVYWLGSAGLLHFDSLLCNADGIPTNANIGAWRNGSNGEYGVGIHTEP